LAIVWAVRKLINAKVDELQMGYIEHSTSPYSIPIVMVKKKTDKWRLCIDFRQINAKSIKDAYPMPRINYILDQLREARYISSLDLKDEYWQIPLKADSRHYTAFTVPGKGLFQWREMLDPGAGPGDRSRNVASRICLPG